MFATDKTFAIKSIVLFAIAFVFRAIFGIIFFGGIDLRSYAVLAYATLNHSLPSVPFFNYFPLGAFYWWFAGWLHVKTALPYAFAFKVVPIFFDALLTVLIYQMLRKRGSNVAFACGLLYAFSPLTLIIDCMHGQWESVFLFFLLLSFYIRDYYADSLKKYMCVGFLFAVSFLIKPLSIIFLPLLIVVRHDLWKELLRFKKCLFFIGSGLLLGFSFAFFVAFWFVKSQSISLAMLMKTISAWGMGLLIVSIGCLFGLFLVKIWKNSTVQFRRYLVHQGTMFTGMALTFFIACIGFIFMHFDMKALVDTILRCFNQGSQIIGIPFAWPFTSYAWLAAMVKNRVWFVLVIFLISLYYYLGRFSPTRAMLLILVFIMGFTGLSPQYLVWLVPMMLLEEQFGFSAFFNLCVSCVFLLYYANPFSNAVAPYQNILSFAVLKGFRWLMPPVFLLDEKVVVYLRILGNYVLPFLCIVFFIHSLRKMGKTSSLKWASAKRPFFAFFSGFLLINIIFSLVILMIMFMTHDDLASQFYSRSALKLQAYDLCPGSLSPTIGIYGGFCWFNIVFILMFIALVWSGFAFWLKVSLKRKENL